MRKQFSSPKTADSGPYIYVPISADDFALPFEEYDEKINKLFSGYKKSGFRGVIPYVDRESDAVDAQVASSETMAEKLLGSYEILGVILKHAKKNSMSLAYMDQKSHMTRYLNHLPEEIASYRRCNILQKYEFECISGTHVKRAVYPDGELMSIVAVDVDTLEIIDLREFITEDGQIEWDVPDGNWAVHQYLCIPDKNSPYINMLSYESSLDYITATFKYICDMYPEYMNETLDTFVYGEVQFAGKNRRAWDPSFNKEFKEMFGIDPAPHYPALYMNAGKSAEHWRAMFTSCRAKLLTEGYMKAVSDFTAARGMFCTGCAEESKSAACSWISGDNVTIHKYASAPGASLPYAYLYGLNSIKVASGAALGFNREIVTGEMFKKYRIYGDEILYRETMTAFARGVNRLFTHLGSDSTKNNDTTEPLAFLNFKFTVRDDLSEYCEFVSRVQLMLEGGRHVSDIAVIYPIHYLMSQVYLYETPDRDPSRESVNRVRGVLDEYPSTPDDADYMTLINSVLNYSGRDADLIHPDIISEKCYTENGILYLKNETTFAQYKVIILPGSPVMSVKCLRILKKFYDEGGKIVSTVRIPEKAFEFSDESAETADELSPDNEVKSIVKHIFGVDSEDRSIVKNYYVNRNDNGGIAYFFHATKTASDGTGMVDGHIISEALKTFEVPYDVELIGMRRFEYTGILNHYLPVFEKIGIHDKLSHSGSINYIHKKYAGSDIFYIANTTEALYENKVLLKGTLNVEEWNPHTGKIKKIPHDHITKNEMPYTQITLKLEGATSIIIVGT